MKKCISVVDSLALTHVRCSKEGDVADDLQWQQYSVKKANEIKAG